MTPDEPTAGKGAPSLLRRWLREPLLHVLLIGLALFAVYAVLDPGAGGRQDSSRIVITADDLTQMQIAWMAQWQRPPTPDELAASSTARSARRSSPARRPPWASTRTTPS